jgi:hypothetical protein
MTVRQAHFFITRTLFQFAFAVGLILIATLLSGCATDDGTRIGSEPANAYANSNADPSSYGADGFTFNKKQFIRPKNDFMFYYKNCSLTGERGYYSRTDYACSEP